MATYGTKDGPKVPQRETLANEQWSESALAGVPYDAWLAQDFYDDPSLARRYKAVVWSGFCASATLPPWFHFCSFVIPTRSLMCPPIARKSSAASLPSNC